MGFVERDSTSYECILQVDKDIEYLLELSKDPKKCGKLIESLDPSMDRIDNHVVTLQNRLTDELNRRTEEFEKKIKVSDPNKKLLVDDFKREMSKKLQVERLTEQNIIIRRILDKIRQTLII